MSTQETSGTRGADRWPVVVAMGLVIFMATLDMSVANVALPVIEDDFGVGTDTSQWVVLGYLLPLVAVTLPSGRYLDRAGARSATLLSVGGFGASSLAVGCAPTLALVIAARAVQGAFAGVLFALLPIVVTGAVRPEARGRAMSIAVTLGPLGSVAGPAVGGVLVETWGWPWIFWINVPVALGVIHVVRTRMPRTGSLVRPARSMLVETVLVGIAGSAVLLALTFSAGGRIGWIVLVAAAAPALWAWRRLPTTGATLTAIRDRTVGHAHLGLAAAAISNAALLFLLPFFTIRELDLSPAAAGMTILAFPAATAAFGPLAGVLADSWGMARTSTAGAALLVAGSALLVPLSAEWSPVDVGWRLAVTGAGMGLFFGPNMTQLMVAAPPERIGTVSATSSLTRELGFALGPTLVTAVWTFAGSGLPGLRMAAAVPLVAAAGALGAAVSLLRRARQPSQLPSQSSQQPTQEKVR